MDDFSKYEQMRSAGASVIAVYRTAVSDRIQPITRIRLLRQVFGLSLGQAKEVTITADSGKPLNEFQAGLLGALEEVVNKKQI